jgi:hypothetical protein
MPAAGREDSARGIPEPATQVISTNDPLSMRCGGAPRTSNSI